MDHRSAQVVRAGRGKLVVAAAGGVAAVKTPTLLRRLLESGFEVKPAATPAAYHFVTRLSLAVAAGREVFDQEAWFSPVGRALHIELARWADALVVAPATADLLARAATGRAEDVVSALIVSGIPKVFWVPAMNTAMWEHPAVSRNVATLQGDGHHFIGPAVGKLATVTEGEGAGRMVEPDEVVAELLTYYHRQDLSGKRVLVSAGPTREFLDPVRFLSNPSSGKMGFAVAEAAKVRGADVTLVTGPTSLVPPPGVTSHQVVSADEMLNSLQPHFERCDLLVMTAAVADWRPRDIAPEKQPKGGEEMVLQLVRTPDILATLAQQKEHQVIVGFAMETDQGVERAADKARRKSLDFICLNYPAKEASSFGGDNNQVTLVTPAGEAEALPLMAKRVLADVILDRAFKKVSDS